MTKNEPFRGRPQKWPMLDSEMKTTWFICTLVARY